MIFEIRDRRIFHTVEIVTKMVNSEPGSSSAKDLEDGLSTTRPEVGFGEAVEVLGTITSFLIQANVRCQQRESCAIRHTVGTQQTRSKQIS